MRRQEKVLSSSLEHKLNLYALAASAAGVGLLALTPPAEAKIVYTPAHVKILDSSYYLVLNQHGIPDFVISNGYGTSGGQNFGAGLEANGVGRSTFVETSGSSSGFAAAAALPRGAQIPPGHGSRGFKKAGLLLGFYDNGIGGYRWGGKWRNAKDLYLGLKFQIRGQTHYGWARISLTDGSYCEGILTGYAYETVPNKPIIAGKTEGANEVGSNTERPNPSSLTMPAPAPATLGALALGSTGLST